MVKNSMTVRGTLIPNMNPYDGDSDNSILVLDNCCIREGVALPGVIVLNKLLCQPHAEGLEDLLPVGGV